MTQTISSNKFCPALNLFLFTLRKNLGFTAIATILVLILSPFYLLMQINEMEERFVTEYLDFVQIFGIPAIFIAVGSCALFGVLLYVNFNFLYSKSSADAYNSMPISRVGLMFSRFLASFVSALIPLITGYIGFFICANMEHVDADMGMIWQCFGFSAQMMLFCGAFIFLFVVVGGTVFDSLVSLFAAGIGIPLIAALVFSMCEDNLYGCTAFDYSLVRYVSPFVFALYRFASFMENRQYNTLFDLSTVITVTALTLLFIAIGLLLFKNRKAESAGSPFAWKIGSFVIGFVVAFVCYFIMGAIFANDRLSVGFFVPGMVGIALGAIIYNVVTNRGFKKIKEAVLVIVATVLGVTFVNIAVATDIMGFETYVPSEDQIEAIDVTYRGMELDIRNYKLITDLHQKIAQYQPEIDGNSEYIGITYTLENNKRVNRRYFMPTGFAIEERTAILNHEITAQLENNFNEFRGDMLTLSGFFANGDRYIVNLERSEAQALVDAYIADLTTVKSSEIFGEDYIEFERVDLNGYYTIPANNKYDDEIISRFNFTFRNCSFYENFQKEFSKIDIVSRNSFSKETEKKY